MKEIDKMIEEKLSKLKILIDSIRYADHVLDSYIESTVDEVEQAMREAYEAGYENGKQDALIAIKQIHKILQDFKEETNEKE